jgi:hypothetical protein
VLLVSMHQSPIICVFRFPIPRLAIANKSLAALFAIVYRIIALTSKGF